METSLKLPFQQEKLLPIKRARGTHGGIKKHLNKVHLGDVFNLLAQLPNESVDMVFGDPDYNVGIKYNNNNYTRDFEEYLSWYTELTKEAMRVLKKDGNLFMMNYPKQNAHLRVRFLDGLFPHISEYVWVYNTNVGHTPRRFTTAHRSILHVRKSENNKFFKDEVALPYKNQNDRRIKQNIANGSAGRMPYSWFEFNLVKNVSKEKTYHACQIPQKLTEMLIKGSTKKGDAVLVLFAGSGGELEVCKNLGRNFVSAEIDPEYHRMVIDRLQHGRIDEKYRLKKGQRVSVK
jgi:DNA modification methylase